MIDKEISNIHTPNFPFRGLAGLYIIPTPIGNLADFTFRAVEILKQVDLILAEDTRTSSVLLNHYQIQKPISPYHQHNEHKIVTHLTEQMQAGKTIALLTDAGTPGISDPAFLLVRACVKHGKSRMFTRCYSICTCFGK